MAPQLSLATWTGFREGNGFVNWQAAVEHAARLRERITREEPTRVLAAVPSGLHLVCILLAARGLGTDVLITESDSNGSLAASLGADVIALPNGFLGGFDVHRMSSLEKRRMRRTDVGLWLLSSGTTGSPHPTHWSWSQLAQDRDWNGEGSERWALGYSPHSFAGVSALCQALGRAASVEFVRPADLASSMPGDAALTVVAATPSFWRVAAIAAQRSGPFRQVDTVTLGGEAVNQQVLDLIREVAAPRRIKQIFGTAELGVAIVVDDGMPGLPAAMRGERMANGAAFEVAEDHLIISSAPGLPFVSTGDLVRLAEGRIHIVGRVGINVNVGGMNVNPYRVAQVLEEHEAVLAARAYGIRSPILGQVVIADVVPMRSLDSLQLITNLKRYAETRLKPHERPLRINVVDEFLVARSGKAQM